MKLHKLTGPDDTQQPVVWPHVYRTEQTTGPQRIAIAPREAPLDVMLQLAERLGPEYFLLYVHAVPRSGSSAGRYESPPLSLVDVKIFVAEYEDVLANDARHTFWIGSTENRGLLVYDEHGLIYAYGPLAEFEADLEATGIMPGEFSIPVPHMHHFHSAYDEGVERILAHWDWRHLELQPEDER